MSVSERVSGEERAVEPEDKDKDRDKERERERIVKAIMHDLELEGESKERLIGKLVEQCGYDEARVRYRAKRAFITVRYQRLKEHQ